jgi:membrane protein
MTGNLTTSRWLGRAFVRALRAWVNPDTPRDAAAISYFSLITLFPAILVLIAVVDAFLPPDVHKLVVSLMVRLFPGSRTFLRANFSDITALSPALVLSCVIVVLWASTWIFTFVENALNRAWDVPRRRTFWESRIRSIGLLVMGGALLVISSGFTILVSAARYRTTEMASAYAKDQILDWLQSSILLAVGFLLVILVYTVTFKLMPEVRVSWKEALPGAIVSSLSWEVAVYIFAKLVPHFDYQRVYGQIGVIITLLVWVYTSCLIMLLGANFSAQLKRIAEVPKPADQNATLAADKVRRFARPR